MDDTKAPSRIAIRTKDFDGNTTVSMLDLSKIKVLELSFRAAGDEAESAYLFATTSAKTHITMNLPSDTFEETSAEVSAACAKLGFYQIFENQGAWKKYTLINPAQIVGARVEQSEDSDEEPYAAVFCFSGSSHIMYGQKADMIRYVETLALRMDKDKTVVIRPQISSQDRDAGILFFDLTKISKIEFSYFEGEDTSDGEPSANILPTPLEPYYLGQASIAGADFAPILAEIEKRARWLGFVTIDRKSSQDFERQVILNTGAIASASPFKMSNDRRGLSIWFDSHGATQFYEATPEETVRVINELAKA